MVIAPWFTDPTDNASYPLRSLFQEFQGSISFNDFHRTVSSRFPDVDPRLLDVLIHTDPMITIRGSSFHYNWPGTKVAKEILEIIVVDLDDKTAISSVWERYGSSFQSYDIEDIYEFQSFLAFRQDLLVDGNIDVVSVSSLLEFLDSNIDSDDPILFTVLDYLDSVQGYASFEEISSHCSFADAEIDSIKSSMSSCPFITQMGNYFKTDNRRTIESFKSFRWPRDSKLFIPAFFRDNEEAFKKLGYHHDFELIKDLRTAYPESISHICIFDTHSICSVIDDYIKELVKSKISRYTGSEWSSHPNQFVDIISNHIGSSFTLSEVQMMVAGVPRDIVIHALYSCPNTHIEGDRVWVYDIDIMRLSEILSDYSDAKAYGICDVLKDSRIQSLNIVTTWGLISLLMRYFPEIIEPVTGKIDLSPFGKSNRPCSELDSSDEVTENQFSSNDLALYEAIEKSDNGNLFSIRKLLHWISSDDLNVSICNLINSGCIKRGSRGLICIQGRRPNQSIDKGHGNECSDMGSRVPIQYIHGSSESRLFSLQSFEELMSEVIEESVGYEPASPIPRMISSIKGKRIRDAVQAVLYEDSDIDRIISGLKDSELEQVLEFFESITYGEDRMLFSRFDIPSNLFMFLFNRSREYYNALSFSVERGNESPQNMLIDMMNNGLMVRRSESSDGLVDVRVRYFAIFDSLNSKDWLLEKSDEIDAIMYTLFMFNEYSLHRYELVNLCRLLIGHDNHVDSVVNGPLWSSIPDFVHVTPMVVEFHTMDAVMGINDFLISTNDYAHEIVKYMKSNRDELIARGLFDVDTLPWFIHNLGLVTLDGNFILGHGNLHDSIFRFVDNNQLFEVDLVLKKYIRKFGGDREVLKPIVADICSSLQKQETVDDRILNQLRSMFDHYQWVTRVNARSMVEDRCGHKGMFNASLMHTLGFNAQGDAFYRTEYKNFRECLRDNEFSGDDLYLDNSFRVKMECNELNVTIQYFVVNLMWIRVSDCRYINLRSEKFEYLFDILKKYKKNAYESCEGHFMTPYSFSKRGSGFPEIDEDDFGLEFYEDVLLASRSKMSSIGGYHVFYNPVDSEYSCTAPNFIKYIITTSYSGTATVAEVQETLETEYGIRLSLPTVRQFANQSCILVRDLDRAYSSKERYLEDVQGVQ